jgi:hypothetical protein
MMNGEQREALRHDVAYVTGMIIVEMFAPLLLESEKKEALDAVFERIKAGLERFESELFEVRRQFYFFRSN